jgi:hypothetical protein
MKPSRALWTACAAVLGGLMSASAVLAAPYASNVSVSGTTVNFILNENADSLTYSINGGPPQPLPPTKGTQTFNLTSPSDKFSIQVAKNDPVGYSIPTGGTIAASANGLSQTTNAGGFRLISDDSNVLNRFNSPRGVAVNNNPNSPNFGTAYIANSAAGSTTGVVRALGDGLYAVHADQSDAFGYGNTAQSGISDWSSLPSSSAPFRVSVGPDNNVYISDFSDTTGNVWRMSNTLGSPAQVFAGTGGPSTVPAGQNHGSSTAVYVEGNSANGNLKVYTLDEDLTGNQFGQPGTADKNNLWRYDVGTDAAMPYNGTPTRVNASPALLTAATSDLDRGVVNGNWYLAQNRAAGNEAGVFVLSPDGSTVLFDSLSASRTLLGNPTASDILRNIQGMDVSDDQRWMALMLNNSDVAVVPMVNGIPDLANRLLIDTGTDVNSGRDIAFDAADNIHYVSSGQALYRVLSPGGQTFAMTSFDGNGYTFSFAVPEPTTLGVLALAAAPVLRRRRIA